MLCYFIVAICRYIHFAQGSFPSYLNIISDQKISCENKNCIKNTHTPFPTHHLIPFSLLPAHMYTYTHFSFFLNNWRVSYIHCSPFLLNSLLVLFPKNRDNVLHNHHSVINFSDFNIDKVFYLIYHLCCSFVSWPNNVL